MALLPSLDRVQVLHSGDRDREVWLVLGVSKRRELPLSARPATRFRTQVAEEGD